MEQSAARDDSGLLLTFDIPEGGAQVSPFSSVIRLTWRRLLWWSADVCIELCNSFFTARSICISAVYAVTRCPSVTFASCAKTNKDIFEIWSLSHSSFSIPNGVAMFRREVGNPLNGGVECNCLWENDDFRPISRSIWETVIVRWAHSARQFVSTEFSFHPYDI